jgi:ankyrin repeat protein
MNEVPPGQDEADDADDLYRRASALDDSRPSGRVRRRVLDHAAQLAAERAAQISAAQLAATRAANRRWRRPAIFGTLAAAALAGLLVTPRFFSPGAPPPTASQLSTANSPPPAAPPRAESHLQEAQAPAAYAPAPPRTPARTAEFAAKNNLAAPKIMDSARSRAAASAEIEADARRGQDVTSGATASGATAALAPPHSVAPAAAAPRASDPAAELRQAAETGDIPRLQILLGRQPEIDARDANGRTALMLAVLRGESRAVDMLLASGADPNAADESGTAPLQAAIAANQPAIAAALQRAGAR